MKIGMIAAIAALALAACDGGNPCSDVGQDCAGLQNLDFGVCQDPPEA